MQELLHSSESWAWDRVADAIGLPLVLWCKLFVLSLMAGIIRCFYGGERLS